MKYKNIVLIIWNQYILKEIWQKNLVTSHSTNAHDAEVAEVEHEIDATANDNTDNMVQTVHMVDSEGNDIENSAETSKEEAGVSSTESPTSLNGFYDDGDLGTEDRCHANDTDNSVESSKEEAGVDSSDSAESPISLNGFYDDGYSSTDDETCQILKNSRPLLSEIFFRFSHQTHFFRFFPIQNTYC